MKLVASPKTSTNGGTDGKDDSGHETAENVIAKDGSTKTGSTKTGSTKTGSTKTGSTKTGSRISGGAMLALGAALMLIALPADARDDRLRFPIADAMNTPDAKAKLVPQIRFFFGTQKHAAATRSFGEFTANRKTTFVGKKDKEGCEWVFLSSAIVLQERARQLGGNAVVNIRSAYKNIEFSSETEYECGAGTFAGGVALRGEVVLLP